MTDYTVDQLKTIVREALDAASLAASIFFNTKLDGVDSGACGFTWVNIYGVKGNSKLGRALKAAGVEQDYNRAFQIWNPSKFPCQNIDTLEAGAIAAANVFKKYGFDARAGSRLD